MMKLMVEQLKMIKSNQIKFSYGHSNTSFNLTSLQKNLFLSILINFRPIVPGSIHLIHLVSFINHNTVNLRSN
jgi:hypothetical protein